ncbi:hypothetical protein [Pseudoalteromonas sp. OOF1S-7]|nr:hypothetical protein [Pseudoalteromonas sp. OOF1S-7]
MKQLTEQQQRAVSGHGGGTGSPIPDRRSYQKPVKPEENGG